MTGIPTAAGHCNPRGLLARGWPGHHRHGRGRPGGRGASDSAARSGSAVPAAGAAALLRAAGAPARRRRTALLTLLDEEPRNGYQLMQEIEHRSDGVWRPSPGSVYPALQQLEDEGLVRSDESEGRKLFHLTDAGRKAAEAASQRARRGTWPASRSTPTPGSCSASPGRSAWRSSRSPRSARPSSSPRRGRSSPTPAVRSTASSPRTMTSLKPTTKPPEPHGGSAPPRGHTPGVRPPGGEVGEEE